MLRDLQAFLKQHKDDATVEELMFEEFGCGYDPRPAQSVRDWLGELAKALKKPVPTEAEES